jgi:hypothetical protein
LLTIKSLPVLVDKVEEEGLSCHGVATSIACGSSEQNDLVLADKSDRVTKPSLRDVSVCLHLFYCSWNDGMDRGSTTEGSLHFRGSGLLFSGG